MIHGLFIAYKSFYGEKELKHDIVLVVLKRKDILDTYINVDRKYL